MRVDFHLFDLINGMAGRFGWLDAAGQYLAVFGLLAVLLAALSLLWWPRLESNDRRRYLISVLIAGGLCALLFGLEWLLAEMLHLQRARPSNARWATLLITEQSGMAFPAWPAALAIALAVPTLAVRKALGTGMAVLGVLLGIALIFVGVNYPTDVLTGIFLGATVGYTASYLAALADRRRMRLAVLWIALLLWSGLLAVAIRPAATDGDRPFVSGGRQLVWGPRFTHPAALTARLRTLTAPASVTLEASGNGHLCVASAQITFHESPVEKARAETEAKKIVNAVFAGWPAIDLLTVTVSEEASRANVVKTGTLYTVTVAREDCPPGGFPPGQALPGRKFFHPRYYRE